MTAIGPAVAQHAGARSAGADADARRRRRHRAAHAVALSCLSLAHRAASARAVVGPLRPPARRARLGLRLRHCIARRHRRPASSIGATDRGRASCRRSARDRPRASGRAIIRDLFDRERAAAMSAWSPRRWWSRRWSAPLIGGILDTAFGWQAIFLFLAMLSAVVLMLGHRRRCRKRGHAVRSTARARISGRTSRGLAPQPRDSTATCWPPRSARRRSSPLSAAAPHVVVTHDGPYLGRIRPLVPAPTRSAT